MAEDLYLVTERELQSATVNAAGELEFTRENGQKINAGPVVGPKGDKGDRGDKGLDGANVLPTSEAVAQAIVTPGPARDQLSATIAEGQTRVSVGPGAQFETIEHALGAFPNGAVFIELKAGTHTVSGEIVPLVTQKNVTIAGQGMGASIIQVSAGFLNAGLDRDGWTLSDFTVVCTTATNTADGIKVDYPRRWVVSRVRFEGFGGTSVWFRGGIQSRMEFNYAIAKDSANVNGFAGFRCDKSIGGVVATAFLSRHNYVGSGKQYGYYFEQVNVGSVFEQDTAELCDVGMRFVQCVGELRSPYTEANRLTAIEMHDSPLALSGRFRDLPQTTWASIAATDRYVPFISRGVMNPGKALIFSSSAGPADDPSSAVSVRKGSGSPNGVHAGVPGSVYLRDNGSTGRQVYVKETGTGNTGWAPLGLRRGTTTEFINAQSSVNSPDKYEGQMAWNTSTKRMLFASGAAPTADWLTYDGTVAHTPL